MIYIKNGQYAPPLDVQKLGPMVSEVQGSPTKLTLSPYGFAEFIRLREEDRTFSVEGRGEQEEPFSIQFGRERVGVRAAWGLADGHYVLEYLKQRKTK
jgi:hypothetical protein